MLTYIVGLLMGIALFFCSFLGFRQGLRLGMTTVKGNIPEPLKSPITALEDYKTTKEQAKKKAKEEAEIMAMLAYNGDAVKEGE